MRQRLNTGGQGVGAWLARRWDVGLVLLLCLCVFFQMLGVPAPLLNAGGSFEIGESSIQEGWSIHSLHLHLPLPSGYVLVADTLRLVCVPILAGALFRPPLS
jgi:hypothetical protein